jgi:hypothetical protein
LWEDGEFSQGNISGSDFTYEGKLHNGKFHGFGHLRTGANYFYKGNFVKGKYDGEGI